MRKILIAAGLMLIATPALAGWAKTKWGMTPAQVVAVVPGAVASAASDDTDMMDMHQLAEANLTEGQVKLTAGFYFDAKTNGLKLVDIVVDNSKQCPDYLKALQSRLGEGDVTHDVVNIRGHDLPQMMVGWRDAESGDEMIFVGVFIDQDQKGYALCKLMHWGPE